MLGAGIDHRTMVEHPFELACGVIRPNHSQESRSSAWSDSPESVRNLEQRRLIAVLVSGLEGGLDIAAAPDRVTDGQRAA